ncbi:MAG: hypothetical protein ACRD5H_14400, partial [Nitrososphaerales archaeon]
MAHLRLQNELSENESAVRQHMSAATETADFAVGRCRIRVPFTWRAFRVNISDGSFYFVSRASNKLNCI